jgi:hypothetical protein
MRLTTALITVRAAYVLATFFLGSRVAHADSAPMSAPDVIQDDATRDNQDVALPPQNSYRSHSLHRLSRGCGFHFDDLRHGLSC